MFLVGGIEGGLFMWLPLHAARSVVDVSGATALTALLIAYVPGRVLHASLAARCDTARYLLAITGGALLFALALQVPTTRGAFLTAIIGLGVLLAGVFPTTIALAVRSRPEQRAPVNAGLTAVAYLGIAIGPLVAGHIAAHSEVSVLAVPTGLGGFLFGTLYRIAGGEFV